MFEAGFSDYKIIPVLGVRPIIEVRLPVNIWVHG
jgi:hypothetical protein